MFRKVTTCEKNLSNVVGTGSLPDFSYQDIATEGWNFNSMLVL